MNRQSNIFTIPTHITNEINTLCQAVQAPLTPDQYRTIRHLMATLFTRGVITSTTADQISETTKLLRD